jgi:hypothetical protein
MQKFGDFSNRKHLCNPESFDVVYARDANFQACNDSLDDIIRRNRALTISEMRQLYWRGGHWKKMEHMLHEICSRKKEIELLGRKKRGIIKERGRFLRRMSSHSPQIMPL